MTSYLARLTSLIIFSISVPVQSFAQFEEVTQPLEWFAFSSTIKIGTRLSLLEELHYRSVDYDPQQFQYRTGLDVSLSDHFSVMPIGYVYTWNYIYGEQPATFANNEHRLFEQVMYKHTIGRASLSHRARLEQRFTQVHANENGEVVYKGYDLYMNRFRYRLQMSVPFAKDVSGVNRWSFVFYDEIFVDFGKSVTYTDPDQNRLFAGVAHQFNKKFTLQGGPLYQYLVKSNGVQAENNIGFQLQANLNVDLTKKL